MDKSDENVRALLARLVRLMAAPVIAKAREFVSSRQLQTLLAGLAVVKARAVWIYIRDVIGPLLSKTAALSNILKSLNYLFSYFRKALGKRDPPDPQPKVELHSVMSEFIKESRVANSVESPMSHHQSEIIVCNANKKAFGKGFRMFDVFVVPDHVIAVAREQGDGSVWISNAKNGNLANGLKVNTDDAVPLGTDIVGILLSAGAWAHLGIKTVKIGHLTRPLVVSIVGATGMGTTNQLCPAFKIAFGYVKYLGTTMPGYSGALYSAGGTSFAVHLAGGDNNVGINIDYLRALVKRNMEKYQHGESADSDVSIDWVNKNWFEGDNLKEGVRREYYTNDEVYVHYQGRYHILDTDQLQKGLSSNKWKALMYDDQDLQEDRSKKYLKRYDAQPESADFRQSPNPGALESSKLEEFARDLPSTSSGTSVSSERSKKSQGVALTRLSSNQKRFMKQLEKYDAKELVTLKVAQESGKQLLNLK